MKKYLILCAAWLLTAPGAAAESLRVTGRVTDLNDNPLAGVTVYRPGTQNAVGTNVDGSYAIRVEMGDTLEFQLIGYRSERRAVRGPVLDVRLTPAPVEKEQVIVAGFGMARNKSLTGSVQQAPVATEVTFTEYNEVIEVAPRSDGYYPGREAYARMRENRFADPLREPLSTFGLEADGASYSNARRMIRRGVLPPKDAVRVEEFVNYFAYDYPAPEEKEALRITCQAGPCPWNEAHRLVQIGIRAQGAEGKAMAPANLVFLIDVSGSMRSRLPLVQASMKLLCDNLREQDRVAIVTYSGSARIALESTPGSDRTAIRDAIEGLRAGGATAGGAGIRLAYGTAERNRLEGGNNRVILCSDGDFNVGESTLQELESLIESKRRSGIFLTVLGYGMGNYKDDRMQLLAEKGNGNYAYIDDMQEAKRVLMHEWGATLCTVAKDAKLQVEFNPARVASYRLVGYESRLLRAEDFNDDARDAGEIGAGQTVTALYEIIPAGTEAHPAGSVDPLRYRAAATRPAAGESAETLTVKVRYKEPDGTRSRLLEEHFTDDGRAGADDNVRFAGAVAMLAQILRESDYSGQGGVEKVIAEARAALGEDPFGHRREFVSLAESVAALRK